MEKQGTRVTFIIDVRVRTYNKLLTVNIESTIEYEMNSMPYITSLQHKSNQDMTFDHLKATSIKMHIDPLKMLSSGMFVCYKL